MSDTSQTIGNLPSYRLSQFFIQSRGCAPEDFDSALSFHINFQTERHPGYVLKQLWHDHKSQTVGADYDYFGVLWEKEATP
jgi:hypothetical protein